MLDKIMNIAKDLGEQLPIGKSELEQLLFKATSSQNYMLPHEQLYDIAERTYDYTPQNSHDREKVLNHIWGRFKLESDEWRKIYKALYLLDIVLKAGDPRCISSIKANLYKIKSFQTFSGKAGIEKGAGIREKSKAICELLDNPEQLEEERNKTKKLRNKLSGVGVSSGGKYGGITSTNYGGISSTSYSGYSYGSGPDVMYGGKERRQIEKRAGEKPKKTKPKEDEEENEAKEYKRKVKSKTKAAKAAPKEKEEEEKKEEKPAPSKDLIDLLEFDEGDQKTAPKTTNNIAELMPNLLADEENDFGNFTSAPAPAPVMAASWDQPAVPVPQCTHYSPLLTIGTNMAKPAPKAETLFDLVPPVAYSAKEQDEFGEFFDASPAPAKPTEKVEAKKPQDKKGTLWDDAKDMLDMDNLMKSENNSKTKPTGPGTDNFYNALYGRSTHTKGIY